MCEKYEFVWLCCGYKEISGCGRNCEPDVGYRFIREYDCQRCKAGGHAVSRGRDGQGRYAQAITRRENKEELQSVTGPVVDHDGGISAWSNSPVERIGEKPWHKGRRLDADLAWQEEHATRLDDICSRAEQMSLRSDTTPRPVPTTSHYRRSHSPVEVYSTDDDRHSRRSRSSKKPLYGEVMSVADITSAHSRRHYDYARSHYESQDSLDSIPKVTPGSRTRKRDAYDPYDSGYGSHGSHRSHGSPRSHYGSRAGSYAYSTSPQSHVHQTTVAGQQYGYPTGYYGVERTPISLPRYQTY